ncbi:MAG: hypothetical protein UX65_C0006G0040 [Parcubacteria group bacterium GW2011_GWB1_46_8]|nr:MAG: hypothetical protein UX14_C0026G0001 [Parcubacteria group bacterium GW2011_GWF1_45_5]KKU11599.1 MAG: hypothetical protein UX15_C0001G0004 [Parcubacteria group bacterium GW2011_GWA1_45_7]KKU46275.1 MAG: hypothetical protein UX65_C0006G0040 [Parcubacteria group bacterium GW2011_GWB1_46_8]KKU47458.1 MAG: hypothetical protein UX66_C0013G0007 [Parcubacteria group bacterium GW2011_GWF2_46_8]
MYTKELKDRALGLRIKGFSYSYINKKLSISKSSLSYWFKNDKWSVVVRERNILRNRSRSKRQIHNLIKARREKLMALYEGAKIEAHKDFQRHKNNLLFSTGISIYWGEGDKNWKNGIVRISNIDPKMIASFKKFLLLLCRVPNEKISYWLLLYPDLKERTCKAYWMKCANIPKESFKKSIVINGRHKIKRVRFGVCGIQTNNKYLKTKILTWIDLLSQRIVL